MTRFEPIAIVGRACLLPGAHSPEQLWDAVASARDLVGCAPDGRWGLGRDRGLAAPDGSTRDRAWSDRGGYVSGFETVWDPEGFAVPATSLAGLDPVALWTLHTARRAWADAGLDDNARQRCGAIFGNLGFPTAGLAAWARHVWMPGAEPAAQPRNRFMMGGTAALLGEAMALGGDTFCIDAACASSLYAIKLACDRLQAREADVMLAGAVQAADDLFLHVGFTALQALSRTGRSRPFHADADGLLPAEGAGFVTLMRLTDARAAGLKVHGVVRGVGLSNDGRGRGMLAPSASGQARAIRLAYAVGGVDPTSVGLLECHATGTVVGDATEVRSSAEVFAGHADLPIGSLKSNVGHLITSAGIGGLIKVLEAMRHRQRPPSLHCDRPTESLNGTPFRVLTTLEDWASDGPRIAGVSAFGFGGNNAHLVVSEDHPSIEPAPDAPSTERVVVIGAAARHGDHRAPAAVLASLDAPSTATTVRLPLKGLKFPPKDLEQALAQQHALIEVALDAARAVDLPALRTGVFVGMEPDAEVARYGARWRLADLPGWLDEATLDAAKDAVVPALTSAAVVGTMPNIPANRLSSQFDLRGPAFVVASGATSGLTALQLAETALRRHEVDVALVGAVELGSEPVHRAAGGADGDAAVLLVLTRASDAPTCLGELTPAGTATARAHANGDRHLARTLIRAGAEALKSAPPPLDPGDLVLTLPAHAPPVPHPFPLPEAKRRMTDSTRAQRMPPAPALPPVMSPAPPPLSASAPTSVPAARPEAAPWTAERPAAAPTSVPAARPEAARRAAEGPTFADDLAILQQAWFAQQTAAHTHYLQFQQQAAALLLGHVPPPPQHHPQRRHPEPARRAVEGPTPEPARRAVEGRHPEPARRAAEGPPEPSRTAAEANKPGLKLTREQLEIHAGGRISDIYGPEFAPQDGYERQVRMPLGRLLLADRVTGLDAEPCSMKTGTIWTETDVTRDAWYLHNGRMPAGILIESGQADLMLISYLGVDLFNRGERVYRLLGCELTYHGDLPKLDETLQYDIHLDGHAKTGDVRLMFFHYDCVVDGRPQLSVRGGQAGFFTDAELDDSAGCLWTPEEQEIVADPQLDPPDVDRAAIPPSIDDATLRAFADGAGAAALGQAYGFAKAHNRTPTIQSGDMQLLDRVVALDPSGGPWQRGYLRGELTLSPDRWFYDGHFKNDPCMPGTLMFEGCLQAMAIYLTAMGYTLRRDGWRFQPKPELPFQLSCRGQAIPRNELLTYEVFVEEVVAGPKPTLYADLLCTVDGLKAFHARRVALELVPDWPLEAQPELVENITDPVPVAEVDGFRFGYASMLACAWGKPSDAFGPMYRPFDGPRRVARLPGPPYHFMSRVTEVEGPIGVMKAGARVRIEYDIPDDAWYFRENKAGVMPFAVLLEAALQPCGWLASYVGSALTVDAELGFRNLDGDGTIRRELRPGDGTLVTDVTLTNVSATGGMIIESFDVSCTIGGEPVYDLQTVFGFFPPAALANQAGLPTNDAQRELLERACDARVDLTTQPSPYWDAGRPHLADPMLLMLDRVTGIWPDAGEQGLGQFRGEKDVDQGEWFFKAHFFQDPVQPGSLGLEALLQLLQFAMLERNLDKNIDHPVFEAIAVDEAMSWKYRGQVLLHNKVIGSTIELTAIEHEGDGVVARANGSLWVDGKRIYEAAGMAMRIRPGGGPTPGAGEFEPETVVAIDPEQDGWVHDHCPTYTRPSIPMMAVADWIAGADPTITGLRDLKLTGWLLVDEPRTFVIDVEGERAAVRDEQTGEELAVARVVRGGGEPPAPLAALDGEPVPSPYDDGTLFHGPAFQRMQSLIRSPRGASATLDAAGEVASRRWNPVLLDAATHGIPHDALTEWFEEADATRVAYPALVRRLDVYGPTPTAGTVRCEMRPDGVFGDRHHPQFHVQWIVGDRVWADMTLVEAAFPKGPLGAAPPAARRAFLRDGVWVEGVALSEASDTETRLPVSNIDASDWLPGTVQTVYGTDDPEAIAVAEHIARAHQVHPRALPARLPLHGFEDLSVTVDSGDVVVRGDGVGTFDITPVRVFWTDWFDRDPWPVEDLYYGLIERFVDRVVLDDAEAFGAIDGRPTLFLANHETALESLVFSIIASALHHLPTVTVAKAEHRHTWLGRLIQHCFTYPGVADPKVMTFFDRDDRASMPKLIAEIADEMRSGERSAMVHVEGTRAFEAGHTVQKMTGAFIDMALALDAPIVPVRFTGGLPVAPLEVRTEFPVGYGKQSIWFGSPIEAETLRPHPYGDRKAMVIDAINALGEGRVFAPGPADPAFAKSVAKHRDAFGVDDEHAALAVMLDELRQVTHETQRMLDGEVRAGEDWLAELRVRLFGAS